MAELDFFNTNAFIVYPFMATSALPNDAIVDAGFVMGVDSGFDTATDQIALYSVVVSAHQVTFNFTCTTVALSSYMWSFAVELGAPFGSVVYTDISLSGTQAPNIGSGFINIGSLTATAASLGIGTHVLSPQPVLEPALIQNLSGGYVNSINIANDPRSCMLEGCATGISSPTGVAYLLATGMLGDVQFKEGKNIQISVNQNLGSIDFNAVIGYGDGITCQNMLVGVTGIYADNCGQCQDFITSINGITSPSGALLLSMTPKTNIVVTGVSELTIETTLSQECENNYYSSSTESSESGVEGRGL